MAYRVWLGHGVRVAREDRARSQTGDSCERGFVSDVGDDELGRSDAPIWTMSEISPTKGLDAG